MEPRRRALVRLALRSVPALLGLAIAFRLALPVDAEGEIAWRALGAAIEAPPIVTAAWIAAGVALFGATLATAALRFHLLMRAASVPSRFASALHLFLVATFFNTLLPGGVLGDAWRVWQGHDRLRKGPAVLGVVTLERILGLQALGVVALCGAPWAQPAGLPPPVFGGLVGVAAACAFGPFVLLHPVAAAALRGAIDRLPARFARARRVTLEAADGLTAVRDAPRRAAAAIGLSLVCQALPVVAVWTLAQPLEGGVAAPWFAVVVPFVTLMSMLPISIGGTGVRELLFVSLFGSVGMPPAAALALALATGLVSFAWAGVGLALFVVEDRARAPRDDA